MRVEILKAKPWMKAKGGKSPSVGDVIDIDDQTGSRWAGIGLARVVSHDKPLPGAKSSVVVDTEDNEPKEKKGK